MNGLLQAGSLVGVLGLAVLGVHGASVAVRIARDPLRRHAFLSGNVPAEHAVSRFHVRWYAVSMVFLAFDVEMIFMYPWTLVVHEVGVSAIVEMFGFLLVLLAGVVYAWREGALRWT